MKILNVIKGKTKKAGAFEIEDFIYWRTPTEYALDKQVELGNFKFYINDKIHLFPLQKLWSLIFESNQYMHSTYDLNSNYRKNNTKFYLFSFYLNQIDKNLFKMFLDADKIEIEISNDLYQTNQLGLISLNSVRASLKTNKIPKPKINHKDKLGQTIEIGDLVIGSRDNNLHLSHVKKLCPTMLLLENNVYIHKNSALVFKKTSDIYPNIEAIRVLLQLKN